MSDQTRQGWIAWFAHNPVAANLLMITILLLGLTTALNIRTEGFPPEAPRTITVTVGFDGASPQDVEEGAAIKVEQALNGVAGIAKISSTVTANEAMISVDSVDGYSLDKLKEDIETRVNAITSFPAQVTRTTVAAEKDERHVIYVQVSGTVDHQTLKQAAQRVRKDLLRVPTVSKVTTEGTLGYAITVELSESKLRAFGLTPEEVARSIQGQSVSLSAGTLETGRGTFTLQSRNQAYFGADFEQTIIRTSPAGGIIRLGDVANVVDGFEETSLISLFDGVPSVRLDVQLTGRDSITAASDSVAHVIGDIGQQGYLPDTITLSTWSDESQNIRDRLALMSRNALIGMGLVFVMLALFLNMRVALWVAVGIPISFAGTLYVIGPSGFDYSLNDLTTFAFIIVLGIVVDDAIVIGENIYAHKQRDGGGVETAVGGAQEVAIPATFGVLTTVAAFFPLTMMSSDFGGPFRIIAVVVIICLLFSLVESKLILPAHLAGLRADRGAGRHAPGPFAMPGRAWRFIQNAADWGLQLVICRAYLPLLRLAIRNLFPALVLCFAVLVATLGLLTRGIVPVVFFPDGESNMVYVAISLESGAPESQTRAVTDRFERSLIRTSAEYQDRYNLPEAPVRTRYVYSDKTDSLLISVELAGGTDRRFPAAQFAADWRLAAGHSAAIKELDFYTGFSDIRDLEIELSATEPHMAEQAMQQLADTLARYAGVNDIKTTLDEQVTELTFEVLPLGERLGVTNRSLITQLRNSIYGFEAQKIQRGEEEISLRVRYSRENRDNLADLDRFLVATPQGNTVPLTKVARITSRQVQQQLSRIGGRRVLALWAKTDRTVTTPDDVLTHLQAQIFPALAAAYPTLEISIEGEAQQENKATAQLMAGFGMALLGIFALLAIPLRSYVFPLIILCAIPFGIVGAILGHLIIGIPMSLLSFFGVLALSGVVVNDALVLTTRYRNLRNTGHDFAQAILVAAPSRFRAIFLTSVTTFAGLTPLVWETSEQAQILIPMAVSLAFGLVFATLVTLIVIPVLIGVVEQLTILMNNKNQANTSL